MKSEIIGIIDMSMNKIVSAKIKKSAYWCEVRKKRYKKGIKLHQISIIWRKLIHPLLLIFIKIDRKTQNEKIVVIRKNRKKYNNVIFACTHIGGNDIQRVFEAIKTHAYLFLGDPGEFYSSLLGLAIFFNGAVYLETRDKVDRKISEYRSIELLMKGGNLLIFPEGAWNIEPSLLVMKMFPGVVRMAKITGCEIVPVAVEVYDDVYFVNIGKEFYVKVDSEINSVNAFLRDELATLKWEIYERQGIFSRDNIEILSDLEFAQVVVNRGDYCYSLQDVYETRYHDRTI